MNKELPRVYANPIDKEFKNNKDIFYSSRSEVRGAVVKENIPKKINEIFASVHHVYKSKVHIVTLNDAFDAVIVGKTNNSLLTLNGDKININNIVDIRRI